MLRSKSSTGRARVASTSSRGSVSSRGRGRGAPGSSSKYSYFANSDHGEWQEWRGSRAQTRYPKRPLATSHHYRNNNSNLTHPGPTTNTNPSNSFETERQENAAKREQRGQEITGASSRGARGTSRGRYQNKSVRFASPPIQPPREPTTAEVSSSTVTNGTQSPFTNTNSNASGSGVTTAQASFNPFAPISSDKGVSSFNTSPNEPGRNPFGTTSSIKNLAPQSNPFGGSQVTDGTLKTNPFSGAQISNGTQQSSVFGYPSSVNPIFSSSNPFGNPVKSSEKPSIFSTTSPSVFSNTSTINPFAKTNTSTSGNGSNALSVGTNNPQRRNEGSSQNPFSQAGVPAAFPRAGSPLNPSKNKLAAEIDSLLRKNGIIAPSWPTLTPGDPSQKAAIEAFWQNTKAYRARVRTCLIRNGYLDDPDKPKKLSEAIDFKGTCEDMCPEFEKVTRIVEHDVQSAEKELSPDGQTYWPVLHKMVKALARSAAGQDAPLPEDVRSPAALRRTLDYLIDTVLGTNDLPAIHGFLWDRTRAIRRDFVFQQSSMTSQELLDQVYCLEQITRFHVVALHQMSNEDVVAEDFSEQQEVEQLGKALLSLIHAYEDCIAQGIHCQNEPEFRAYYVLFNSHNTGILEAVQDWGWKYWGESNDIRTAVSLVETLQNIWDTQGPLNPHSATDIAQNAYYRFFSIVKDSKVSYTMACFAEIHFNKVRKAALKTILASYRKQRDQTTDWTLDRLNKYLHFDDEMDIMTFGKAYGVHFDVLNGQVCLSFESDDQMKDPFPQLKQPHSSKLVERKRGDHMLPEAIHRTVYDETGQFTEEDNSNSLFVPATPNNVLSEQQTRPRSDFTDPFPNPLDDPLVDDASVPDPNTSKLFTQEEEANMESSRTQNQLQAHNVSTSSPGTLIPAIPSSAGNISPFGGKSQDQVENKPVSTTFMFEKISVVPQKDISAQKEPDPSNQSSSSTTSFFPSISATQNTEASNLSVPPGPESHFKSPGSGGILPPPPVTSPSLTSAANTKPLESVSETMKDPPRQAETYKTSTTLEEPKDQSIDQPSRNHLAHQGDRATIGSAPKKSRMATFSQWVALGPDGLIDQFTVATVEKILMQTVKTYVADERKRRRQEEEKLSREEAAHFRFKFLATKYFYAWRDIAHRLWMRRKGRLARQTRRQMAEESFRASQAVEKRDVLADFRASGGAKQVNLEQSLTQARDRPPSNTDAKPTPRGHKSKRLSNSDRSSPPRPKENSPDDKLRKSLLSDSAYLQGGSRIHLIPNYKPSMETRRQPNGVRTDYFRLKARGIMTLPDGTPLAKTAAVHLNSKLPLHNISKSLTPERSISEPSANSVPAKPVANDTHFSDTIADHDTDFEALKARARAVMGKDKEEKLKNKKRYLDDDEAELFASAKRVRDQMDEETLWMRAEIQKTMSRSAS
jgi:nuclear mRNA export protein SAC3